MAKIYTKTGDQGTTCLVSGERVSKNHLRLETYGSLDELNSFIGLARTELSNQSLKLKKSFSLLDSILFQIQNELFNLGSQLANTDPDLELKLPNITSEHISYLETKIDEITEKIPTLKNFILPGGSELSSRLHVCRTICRRCERVLIHLREVCSQTPDVKPIPQVYVQYLNRLSDLLFQMSRFANLELQISDVEWKK